MVLPPSRRGSPEQCPAGAVPGARPRRVRLAVPGVTRELPVRAARGPAVRTGDRPDQGGPGPQRGWEPASGAAPREPARMSAMTPDIRVAPAAGLPGPEARGGLAPSGGATRTSAG